MQGRLKQAFAAVLFLLIAFQLNAKDLSKLESRLQSAKGAERGRILAALVEEYQSDNPKKAIEFGKEALSTFETSSNPTVKVSILNDMGWAYMALGEYETAVGLIEQARSLASRKNDKTGLSNSLNNLGAIAQRRGHPASAVDYFEQSLEIRKEIGNPQDIAMSLNNLGFVYSMDLTDYDRGIEYHLQALQVREELKDEQGIALSLNNIGIVYSRLGDYPKALEHLNRALGIRRKLGLKHRVASTLNNIADVYMKLGEYEKSLTFNQEGLEIRKQIGERSGIAFSMRDIGIAYFHLNRLDVANQNLTEALQIAEESGDKSIISSTLVSLASLHRKQKEYAQAEKLAVRGLDVANSIPANDQIRLALQELAATQEAAGKYDQALDTYKKFKDVNDSIFNDERARRLALLENRYHAEKREHEIERLRKEQALMDLNLSQARSNRNAVVGGTILLGIVGFLLYRRRVESARIAEELSVTDSLTGLRNRRFVQQAVVYDLATSLRKYRGALFTGTLPRFADVMFFILDLDEFKSINDRFGHSGGDEILKQIGTLLLETCRSTDTVARWGGEEFLVISRFTNREDAVLLAERLRARIASFEFEVKPGEKIRCTCSIGYSAFPFIQTVPDAFTWEQVTGFADDALFAAKRSGKNAWAGFYAAEGASTEAFEARSSGDIKKWIEEKQLISFGSKSDILWS